MEWRRWWVGAWQTFVGVVEQLDEGPAGDLTKYEMRENRPVSRLSSDDGLVERPKVAR